MLALRWSLLEWLIAYIYPSKTPQKVESSCCQGLVEATFLVFQPPQHLRPICQICQMGSKWLKIKILLHKWVSGSSKKASELKSSNKWKKSISKIFFDFYYLRGWQIRRPLPPGRLHLWKAIFCYFFETKFVNNTQMHVLTKFQR